MADDRGAEIVSDFFLKSYVQRLRSDRDAVGVIIDSSRIVDICVPYRMNMTFKFCASWHV